MRRRLLSVLGAAALLAVARPGSASAKAGDIGACKQLFRTSSLQSIGETTPHVVTQQVDGGDFSVLWIDGVDGGTTNTLTSCTFHDRNRNGRYDWTRERVFLSKEVLTVAPEHAYSKWPYDVVLTGVAQAEQVCSRRLVSSRSLSGDVSRSTTRTTCYTVEPFYIGD